MKNNNENHSRRHWICVDQVYTFHSNEKNHTRHENPDKEEESNFNIRGDSGFLQQNLELPRSYTFAHINLLS